MKLLIAEDDPVSRRLLEVRLTEWGYDVIAVRDGTEAWEVLQLPDAPQLAILDWMMPGMDGPQICRAVRKRRVAPYTYLILLTVKGRTRDIAEGMDAGADDYIAKPFAAAELRARLRAGLRLIELHSELVSALDALQYEATHDPLTRAWNRAAIRDLLRSELARAKREGAPLTVILADLDHFKQVNDLHGHLAGDSVLCEVTRRMRGALRPYDQIGRFGGEEFLLVLPHCDASDAATVAERLRAGVATTPVTINGGDLSVTLSLGGCVAAGGAVTEQDSLLRTADAALYRAKDGGRNRVEIATLAGAPAECLQVSSRTSSF